ncbi:MAG: 30S ribosomal protein S16 [SAR86 cluster bacterium]|uniref:Small ribosomal subunit protein bS16 n=1 Tax=SAR86 cluster bacterium TaxID=2030880 RepID=A0A520N1F8_9GAMM|nr:MAG: 30S ribosomal protein S16 [SAR86 cluster bacterium]
MVVIRLSRAGAKKRPFYHICVSDRRNKRDGSFIEKIGFFNPIANGGEEKIKVDLDRFEYWTSVGAKPSETVEMLIKRSKLTDEEINAIENKKSDLLKRKKQQAALEAKQKADEAAAEAPAAEAPAEEAPAEEAPEAEAAAEAPAEEAPADEAPEAEAPAEEAPAEEAPEAEAAAEAPAEEAPEAEAAAEAPAEEAPAEEAPAEEAPAEEAPEAEAAAEAPAEEAPADSETKNLDKKDK